MASSASDGVPPLDVSLAEDKPAISLLRADKPGDYAIDLNKSFGKRARRRGNS